MLDRVDRIREMLSIHERASAKLEKTPLSRNIKDSPLKALKSFYSTTKGKPNFYFYKVVKTGVPKE
jgi:hypothetical protein